MTRKRVPRAGYWEAAGPPPQRALDQLDREWPSPCPNARQRFLPDLHGGPGTAGKLFQGLGHLGDGRIGCLGRPNGRIKPQGPGRFDHKLGHGDRTEVQVAEQAQVLAHGIHGQFRPLCGQATDDVQRVPGGCLRRMKVEG